MSAAVGGHHQGPLSLMSCVRESSPQESVPDIDGDKNVAPKRKFWNPRKWFKRKVSKNVEDGSIGSGVEVVQDATSKENLRSRSASEVSETDEPIRRRSGTPLYPGLSVSHDSIFHSPQSGSELELEGAQSSSSLSITHHPNQHELRLQTELSEKLRLRRGRGDTSEDDEGLPRSPCNSPIVAEGLFEKSGLKDHPTKSHSTCSDGSLLSMGSLEMEEDSSGQQSSRHSSKVSLYDKKSEHDSYLELGLSAPLNHSAAHHKVAVRPKRTHGAPRRKRMPQLAALPATPEVNEDSSVRSLTPDTNAKEPVTELYNRMSHTTETKLKCSSLPPGLAGPGDEAKLTRSRSTAGTKSQDVFATLGEVDEEKEEKKHEGSIFSRLFPRRSAKKKKAAALPSTPNNTPINVKMELSANKKLVETCARMDIRPIESRSPYNIDSNFMIRPNTLIRSGPAARQRVQPIDIPESPEMSCVDSLKDWQPPHSPEKSSLGTSPLQMELESHFRQRKVTSPRLLPPDTPPQSPKSVKSAPRSPWMERTHYTKRFYESSTKIEEMKSKVKIAGLSALQQRVMQHNDDIDDGFKSLTEFTDEESLQKPTILKSHSFKGHTNDELCADDFICKSTSLDSVKDELGKSTSSLESASSVKTSSTEYLDSLNHASVTISGPSHVTTMEDNDTKTVVTSTVISEQETFKEQKVSITKIQVKREFKDLVPEFFNIQLNKVDAKPPTNVVLTTSTSPKDEKPAKVFDIPARKFSHDEDDIEIIDRDDKDINAQVVVTPMAAPAPLRIYKKHAEAVNLRKPIQTTENKPKPSLRVKSNSLDIVDSLKKPEIIQTIEKTRTSSTNDIQETVTMDGVTLRKKSPTTKGRNEDEPELLKVFARRSLKLKDVDELSQQIMDALDADQLKDSDKENQEQSPEEHKRSADVKEPLGENKMMDLTDVVLRKGNNNNNNNNSTKKFFPYTRTTSVTVPMTNGNSDLVQKNNSFTCERPKTEMSNKNWSNSKNEEEIVQEEKNFINDDYPSIPKNFNQRKAEWERRSQGIQDAFKRNAP